MRTNVTPKRGLIVAVLALVAAFALAACGGGDAHLDPHDRGF